MLPAGLRSRTTKSSTCRPRRLGGRWCSTPTRSSKTSRRSAGGKEVFAWRAFPARGDASPGAYLAVPALETAGIRVAFTTRHGGFSDDPYSSLNLSFFSGDDAEVVIANRARALAALGADPASRASRPPVHGAPPVRVTRK